jgi:UDP-glucose:(heptosyl)LPS alpha-1,3-glucosyltransferase
VRDEKGPVRYRIAVVSPFIDKRHGTERRVAEWISRLGDAYEVHIYSERVESLDPAKIIWHRMPRIPGPHLLRYLWWFSVNQVCRWWHRAFRGIRYDLVFSPGINCLDADVISVHIVFAEFYSRVRSELSFRDNPLKFWPRLLHRKLYYELFQFLERVVYTKPETSLILIARKTAEDLRRFYARTDDLPVVYIGLDPQVFNPELRRLRRPAVRQQLGLNEGTFTLLLIGNDWKKKGLPSLIRALHLLRELPINLLVVGQDDPLPYRKQIREFGLDGRVVFLPPRGDVEWYYAAADAYVGPSLEDTFAQPPAEAMACALPVITSITNGTSEIISDGVDGLLLQDPSDSGELAEKIRLLWENAALCRQLGDRAAQTARLYTWDRNGEQIRAIFEETLRRKGHAA